MFLAEHHNEFVLFKTCLSCLSYVYCFEFSCTLVFSLCVFQKKMFFFRDIVYVEQSLYHQFCHEQLRYNNLKLSSTLNYLEHFPPVLHTLPDFLPKQTNLKAICILNVLTNPLTSNVGIIQNMGSYRNQSLVPQWLLLVVHGNEGSH